MPFSCCTTAAATSSALDGSSAFCPIRAGFSLSTAPNTSDAVRHAVSRALEEALSTSKCRAHPGGSRTDGGPPRDGSEPRSSSSGRRSSSSSAASLGGSLRHSLTRSLRAHRRRSSCDKKHVPTPSIAFVSTDSSRDVAEVQRELVRQLPPGTEVHGVTSAKSLLTVGERSGGTTAGGAVGCLVLYVGDDDDTAAVPDDVPVPASRRGGFATAFDAAGDGAAAAQALRGRMADPQAILMGTVPGQEEGVLAALSAVFPAVPVYGGTAADNAMDGRWHVLSADGCSGTGVSLVGVGRDIKFAASMIGRYVPTSKRGIATRTEGRRVLEMDGAPADDWMYGWLGDDVKAQFEHGGLILNQTACHPLGIRQASGEYVTNHLASFGGDANWTGFDSWSSWVEFYAPIPQGSELVVMKSREGEGPSTGYRAELIDAYDTAREGGTLRGSEPVAGILIVCGGMAIATGNGLDRGLTDQELSSKLEGVPMLGMTCFGEQGHLPKAKCNVQRNLSTGMILFG